MKECKDKMELTNVFEYPNVTVKVYRPVISDEERARRKEEFKQTCAQVMSKIERERILKERELNSGSKSKKKNAR